MASAIMELRRRLFVLWRPGITSPAPMVVLGKRDAAEPDGFRETGRFALRPDSNHPDLWTWDPAGGSLEPGAYHYFFEINDTEPYQGYSGRLQCSDPFATVVDYRCLSSVAGTPYREFDRQPAAVILFEGGELRPCDVDGHPVLPRTCQGHAPNNRLVIYELPTSWTKCENAGACETAGGTFVDVLSLVDEGTASPNFKHVDSLKAGRALIKELGVNALELLPPADAAEKHEWGYGTRNYLSPDYALGTIKDCPQPTTHLSELVDALQACGMRFFYDGVMAFSKLTPYRHINFSDFLVQWEHGDPEEWDRNSFGGDLMKYRYPVTGYDPLTGERKQIFPSREWMKLHLLHWMHTYGVSGIRLDSMPNIACPPFVAEITEEARVAWQSIGRADQFLVSGEDLSMDATLVSTGCLDSLWNDPFKYSVKNAVVGQDDGRGSFQSTVERMIDCRRSGLFSDGAQAVNYITSHDIANDECSHRLYSFLSDRGVVDAAPRIRLAFVCLLTAVGIPMILAGEEFGDQHDLPVNDATKQIDPVNYNRLDDPWRQQIFEYVANLVRFRETADALSVNDTEFIHWDFSEDKRVGVWVRGRADDPVVVIANFSEWASAPGASYDVPNWPSLPSGRKWREITQSRDVPEEWAGHEPLFPWEAKVYACVER